MSVASPALPVGFYEADSIISGNSTTGQFLLASPLYHSANTGFNFSPYRELGEAVFWNPASIQSSRTKGLFSFLVNLKTIIKHRSIISLLLNLVWDWASFIQNKMLSELYCIVLIMIHLILQ